MTHDDIRKLADDGLRAEAEALERDAARYRWLKSRPDLQMSWYNGKPGSYPPILGNVDDLIDAGMKGEK